MYMRCTHGKSNARQEQQDEDIQDMQGEVSIKS